jgi:hypothetical protein
MTRSSPDHDWRQRKSRDRNQKSQKWSRAHAQRLPHFFLTIVVVQNIPLRRTNIATGCDVTPKMFPWKGVCMRNRKLHNIRPSGRLLTGNDVTWPRRPSSGKYTSAHAWSPVTSLPVASPLSTSRNVAWTVLIYYWHDLLAKLARLQ